MVVVKGLQMGKSQSPSSNFTGTKGGKSHHVKKQKSSRAERRAKRGTHENKYAKDSRKGRPMKQ